MSVESRHVRIGTKNLEPGAAMLNGAIEHGVFGLVEALNRLNGVATIASCHGHRWKARLWKPAVLDQAPYVLFHAPVAFTQALAKFIGGGKGVDGRLHYVWVLYAYFYPLAYEDLAWVLELRDTRIPTEWDRTVINADLSTLAGMAREIGTQIEAQSQRVADA